MSAKTGSRDFAQVQFQIAPRNHVARAASLRATSGAAGKHVRSQGAQRRADKVTLARAVRSLGRERDQD